MQRIGDAPNLLPERPAATIGRGVDRRAIVSDSHLNLLRQVARRLQRALDDHDAVDGAAEPGSTGRRQRLERVAKLARARVAEAEARRLGRRQARTS